MSSPKPSVSYGPMSGRSRSNSSCTSIDSAFASSSMPPPMVFSSSPPLSPATFTTRSFLQHRNPQRIIGVDRSRSGSQGHSDDYSPSFLPPPPNTPIISLPSIPPLSISPVPSFSEHVIHSSMSGDDGVGFPSSQTPQQISNINSHNNFFSSPSCKAAVDAALCAERQRIRSLEESEIDMNMEELRSVLKKERLHSLRLMGELAAMRSAVVQCQAEAEIHEEGRINSLMRRLQMQMENMQREKGRIIVELEREEEMLTNNLQKKLDEVKREKEFLERQIEKEHLSNEQLRAKLDSLSESTSTLSSTNDSVMVIRKGHEDSEEMME